MYAPNRYREEMGLGGIAVYINESRIKTCFVSDSITYASEKGREQGKGIALQKAPQIREMGVLLGGLI